MSTEQRGPAAAPAAARVELDRVAFRPDGHGGLVLADSTLPSAEAVDRWLRVLGPALRRPPAAAPDGALAYVRPEPGSAAVLRRARGSPGAPGPVDGLVGSTADLTPAVAVGLSRRPVWPGGRAGGAASKPDPAELAPDPEALAELRRLALDQDEQLARVLAWTLQAPGRPLGVVGCPPGGREGLLWGLVQIAAPLFGERSWTFTTDDVAPEDAGDPDLPEIVFLAGRPADAVPARTIVDLTQDQGASPENEYAANALVYRYEFGVEPGAAVPGAAAAAAVTPTTVIPKTVTPGPAAPGTAAPGATPDDAPWPPAAPPDRQGPGATPLPAPPAARGGDEDDGTGPRAGPESTLPHRRGRLLLVVLVAVAVLVGFLAGLAVGSLALVLVPGGRP